MELWKIPEEIETIKEFLVDPETGECLTEDEVKERIEALEIEQDKKLKWLAQLAQNEAADAETYKAYKQSFEKKQRAAEKRVESIKKYIGFVLGGEKWEADDKSVKVQFRRNKDVLKVDDLAAVPVDFFKTHRTESNLNKTAIKEAIAEGVAVSGCHLEETLSTIIK